MSKKKRVQPNKAQPNKAQPNKAQPNRAQLNQAPPDFNHIIFSLILIAYGYITVFTPNLRASDANGTKFLFLSVLNIVVFLFLFLRKDQKFARWVFGDFFKNPIAISYSLLLVVSLLSFTVATNVNESIVYYAKLFTVFSTTCMVAAVVYQENRSLRYLAIAMTALLAFDCITVFNDIFKYINGDLPSIAVIRSVYSNKNILASSIFVKIPFALWLVLYEPKWARISGLVVILLSVVATLVLSTRAFYLGTIVLSVVMALFLAIRYMQTRGKQNLTNLVLYVSAVVLGFIIFSLIQSFAYPHPEKGLEQGVVKRMQTITGEDGGGGRLASWNRSLNLIKENPILGVGVGNWKIDILKQENLRSSSHLVIYKNHNDFIEITAETGIFGGLLFMGIFILVFLNLFRVMKKKASDEQLKFAFIPALGLFCYSIDAFFNFPQDRPEIQALFALYTGAAIALSFKKDFMEEDVSRKGGQKKLFPRSLIYFFTLLFAIALTASCYLLNWNFKSMKLQWLIENDLKYNRMSRHSAEKFLTEFPSIPDLTYIGESIALQKARYLIVENRKQEAIELLKSDHSSPYDIMNESFISQAYSDLGEFDSAMVYARKVYVRKPLLFDNIALMASIFEQQNKYDEAEELWDDYLDHTKGNARAWNYAAVSSDQAGNLEKAYLLIDSAKYYFPNDTMILKNHSIISERYKTEPYKEIYQEAISEFNRKNFRKAAPLFTDFLEKVPDFTKAYELRAFCYYYNGSYQKCIEDIDSYVKYGGSLTGNLLNLRGVNYHHIGKKEEACADFEAAMNMGDKDGTNNYNSVCK